MHNSAQKKNLMDTLKIYYPNADETKKVILKCALVAAALDAVGSLIPGVAPITMIISSIVALWVMYGKICSVLNISFKKHTLYILAKAAITNIIVNIVYIVILILLIAAGLIVPGLSAVISAIVVFLSVYSAGYLFLNMIAKLAIKSKDLTAFSNISVEEMKNYLKGQKKLTKEDHKEAKDGFSANRRDEEDTVN